MMRGTLTGLALALALGCVAASPADAPRDLVVLDGDSITQGHGLYGSATYAAGLAMLATGADVENAAISGKSCAQLATTAPTRVDVRLRAGAANTLVIWCGTNDIAVGGATADAAFYALHDYTQARRAAGWRVVVVTMLPRAASPPWPAITEAQRGAFNMAVRATWSRWADGLADVAADPRIGAAGRTADPVYYMDAAHPTAVGAQIVAGIVAGALDRMAPALAPMPTRDWTPTPGATPLPIIGPTPTPGGASMALTDNLMGAWRFDSALTDSSGRGNDLTGSGSPGYAAGKLGNALSLTGTEYAYRADNADLSVAGPFTIVSWINVTGTNFSFIATKHGAAGQREWDFRLQNNAGAPGTSRNLEIFVSNNGTALTGAASTGTLVTPSVWHMVAGGYDGSLVWVQVDNGTVFSTAYSSGVFDSTSEFRIGSRADTGSFKMIGLQDMTMLWDRALTAGELTTLYNSGNGHDPTASAGAPTMMQHHNAMLAGGRR